MKKCSNRAHMLYTYVGSSRLSYLALTATASTVELKRATRIIPTSPTPIAGLPSRVCKPQSQCHRQRLLKRAAATSVQARTWGRACRDLSVQFLKDDDAAGRPCSGGLQHSMLAASQAEKEILQIHCRPVHGISKPSHLNNANEDCLHKMIVIHAPL